MKTWTLGSFNAGLNPQRPESSRGIRLLWLIPILTAAAVSTYFFYPARRQEMAMTKSPAPSSSSALFASEREAPCDYITGQIKMRKNFFDEIVLEGTLRSIAKNTSYENAVLHVDFISKTGTIVFSKDYPINEAFHPDRPVPFKFKNPPSTEVNRVAAKILKADLKS